MCFSAEASFGAGVVLSAFGIAAVLKAKTPGQMIFAITPLVFAVQQFGEGVVWLSLTYENYAGWQQAATYFFLIFSQVIWPVWVPLVTMILEKDKTRKIALLVIFGIGVFLSSFLLYTILFFPQYSNANGQHIQYISDFKGGFLTDILFPILYITATILPLFISSVKRMKLLGAMILLFSLIAHAFYREYEISVWCFFSALTSAMICGMIYDLVNSETKKITVVTAEVKEIIEEKPPEQSATN